jgi:hypothetical protein
LQVFNEASKFEFTPIRESRVNLAEVCACSNFLLLTHDRKMNEKSIVEAIVLNFIINN